jgi:hypothetical protein
VDNATGADLEYDPGNRGIPMQSGQKQYAGTGIHFEI